MPETEICGLPRTGQHGSTGRSKAPPATEQRSRLPCTGVQRLDCTAAQAPIDAPVEPDRVRAGALGPQSCPGPKARRNTMIRAPGPRRGPLDDRRIGPIDHRSGTGGVSAPAKLSKIWTASTPAELPDQVADRGGDQPVDERLHEIRVPSERSARGRAPACPCPRSYSSPRSRERRRSPGGPFRAQSPPHPLDVSKTGSEPLQVDLSAACSDPSRVIGAASGPSPSVKVTGLAEGVAERRECRKRGWPRPARTA